MNTTSHNTERPPVIAIMGHIDHGKSTLLLYIRNTVAKNAGERQSELKEAGGITQHISAYEIEHAGRLITFLDTPGHEAFRGVRSRGARTADIAILVVSAEDGVKPQTIEAYRSIKDSDTPFIVAITKIDKPEANVDRAKQSLAENEIYVEGYGGDIPVVALSAKTGEGIPELLDMILLVADMETLTGDPTVPAQGVIIESSRDPHKGIVATCIIKNGVLKKGMFVVCGTSLAPTRIVENYLGKPVETATFSSPVRIVGWDNLPAVGQTFTAYETRDEAHATQEKNIAEWEKGKKIEEDHIDDSMVRLPLIIKADTGGSLEAIVYEIKKLSGQGIVPHVILTGIGTVAEGDVRRADAGKAIIIGFNVSIDPPARSLADRTGVGIERFDIIYKMSEWLAEKLVERAPKIEVEESLGLAKILKVFSKVKDKQIVGGRVERGSIALGSQVKIIRREAEIGQGKVRELQEQKNRTDEVTEGKEFGTLIEAKVEIAPGDRIESFTIVTK